jgi:SAM-dependent methyltransferase
MNSSIRRIDGCRLCGARNLELYVDFGEVPLGNNLQESQPAAAAAEAYPLEVHRCGECGHFQLGHAVAPELLYATNYTYLSGIGASFVRHFEAYPDWVEAHCDLPEAGLVVDVGSNDGTCLKPFQRRGFRVCGVDPASLPAEIANRNGIETINRFFDADAVHGIVQRHGHADFVTSHNVLAHVDDLAAVFRDIYALLKPGGYFAFEIGYFGEVLRSGCFDTIYHEHLDYHHAAPLARHLTALGFDLLDLSVNAIQGGSLRLLLRKTGEGKIASPAQSFLDQERRSVLYDAEFLAVWKRRIENQMGEFHRILAEYARKGQTIIAYGAPTKATLLMKMAGLDRREVAFVVEDNPHKAGRFLPRTAVPIRPSSALDEIEPDVLVIFAWNFADDIMAKLRGRFAKPVDVVVPLPELRVEMI